MGLLALVKRGTSFGASLLVTGCCIGAGMIGLPVMSSLAGFMPSSLAMFFCYLFTTTTGLLLLEATLWFDKKVNLLSIAEFALGKVGKAITWSLFLFLFYCLFVAYIDAGGQLFAGLLSSIFHHPISREVGILTCVGFVSAITYMGTKAVDNINRGLVLGLAGSYILLVAMGLPSVQFGNLLHVDFTAAVATIPILLICFGYQNLVPSLTYYLKKNVSAIRFAIIIGNMIPFFVYFLWNFVILGMLPATSLSHGNSDMVVGLLQGASQSTSVLLYVKAFSFFAILTSFLPNAMTFVDFLKDGLKRPLEKFPKLGPLLLALVFIPPMVFTLFYPHLFLQALGLAGGLADVLLFGVLPATVILIGRYVKKIEGPYQVMGGILTPLFVLLLSVIFLFLKYV